MLHGKLNCWMNGVRSTYSVHLGRESAWESGVHPWEGRGPAFQKASVAPAAVASGWESHWNHLVPSASLWSLKWLSFQNPLNLLLLLLSSLQTLQPCHKSKSFVSKSKIFIVHILNAKVLHHWAVPRWGQGFTVPMTGMRTCRTELQTINLCKWNSSKGTEGLT